MATFGNGSVAIAAITSCTNTTDPRLAIAAGLLARKARALGLRPPPWVKTSFSPGSPAAAAYLERVGLLDRSGGHRLRHRRLRLHDLHRKFWLARARDGGGHQDWRDRARRSPVRQPQFPRPRPSATEGRLSSVPAAGRGLRAGRRRQSATSLPNQIGSDRSGNPVFLADLWPTGAEIDAMLTQSQQPADYASAFGKASRNKIWDAVEAPATDLYPWDPASTYLRRPPFTIGLGSTKLGHYRAYPIIVLGNDVSTDQISPAGEIPKDSETARYLIAAGDPPDELNVYPARRGNYLAMVRGFSPTMPCKIFCGPQSARDFPSTRRRARSCPLHNVAARAAAKGRAAVIVAGERYGQGSSRDWGAKGPALIGVRAVLANSFERIHRTNLIGMGILPLRLPAGMRPAELGLQPGDEVEIVGRRRNAAAETTHRRHDRLPGRPYASIRSTV